MFRKTKAVGCDGTFEKCVEKIYEIQRSFHSLVRSRFMAREYRSIPCKVWCEYLLGMDWVTKTGLSYLCVTFLKSFARVRQVMAAGRVVAAVNSSC